MVGLYKRHARVYPEVVPNCSKATLQQVIRGRMPLANVIHSHLSIHQCAPLHLAVVGRLDLLLASFAQ